jgi:electron transfer flavoprotein alpha subunit
MDFSYLDSLMEKEHRQEEVEETGQGYRNIWMVAETSQDGLSMPSLEVMGQARDLADQIGVYVYCVLLGEAGEPLAGELFAYGADKILMADDPTHPERLAAYQPETYTKALEDLVKRYHPEILLLPASHQGNDLAPRLAQQLNTGLTSHCIKLEIDMSERLLLGTCPILGGEVYHTYTCPIARPQMATLQPGYFHLPSRDSSRSGEVQKVAVDLEDIVGRSTWSSLDATPFQQPLSLSKAPIVVSAGRGMGDGQGFELVKQLAAALGGIVAGSRGAFDQGWITEDQIVGIGGQMIAPRLYVACGISGDIHHYFGVQDAKFILAINPDEHAPIMKVANIAVVGDAHQVIPALLKALTG